MISNPVARNLNTKGSTCGQCFDFEIQQLSIQSNTTPLEKSTFSAVEDTSPSTAFMWSLIRSQPHHSADIHFAWHRLPGGARFLLVQDPAADFSAMTVNVAAGYFDDPASLPGLAHFLEHAVHLGSDKYPGSKAYKSFLAQHGGSSNASTGELGCSGQGLVTALILSHQSASHGMPTRFRAFVNSRGGLALQSIREVCKVRSVDRLKQAFADSSIFSS